MARLLLYLVLVLPFLRGSDGAWNQRQIRKRIHQLREVQYFKSFYTRLGMPRGVPYKPADEGYITQPLDHFNRRNNATYNQRYWVNEEFWQRPGGPVFLFIGGESAESEYSVLAGEHVELAQKHRALLVSLEHRYYGASINKDGLTLEGIRFLSSQQALADLASFHLLISQKFNLTQKNTWICFGGSYPGSLSAWFRLKFPHLVYAAVASSAPVRAELNFIDYNKVVANSLSDPVIGGSEKCLDKVKESFRVVESLLTEKSVTQLEKDFFSCAALHPPEDYMEFVSNLADIFMGAVQYNNESPGSDVRKICERMISASSAYEGLKAVNSIYMEFMGLKCVENSHNKSLSDLKKTELSPVGVGERQWYYQTCTEFGYYQTCDHASCPFSPRITLQFQLDICKEVFQIPTESVLQAVQFTNEYYGADHPKSSRIIFVNGDVDPWHALSVLKNQSHSEIAIFINGTAHCANMGPSRATDPPSLQKAREEIGMKLGEWLKSAREES
ncbi:PREDICTED: thymus-specific serine protease-like [Nanorana parkeri]|uniref:thymus-specific serine protease-like n=1 Tax=Nanorana parkeri TaxID=125878 RepID=UPI000854E9C6|nr:PREDICTED: thymus-specific serine protease-like [Nanorana parkeri]